MPQDQGSYQAATAAAGVMTLIMLLIGLAVIVFSVVIYWRIFSKAGYSGALGLLMFVPIANIIVLCILAFGTWPIYKELNYLRQQVAQGQRYPSSPQQYPSSPQNPKPGRNLKLPRI